jgi:hypothetical protein
MGGKSSTYNYVMKAIGEGAVATGPSSKNELITSLARIIEDDGL